MGSTHRNANGELISGINVTPLVDVVLVLLVVLMVTAGYIVSKTIPVDLPKAATGETTSITLSITLDAHGKRYLDGRPTDEAGLRTGIRRARADAPDVRAIIAADGAVPHRDVIFVVDVLRQEGLYQFAFNIDPHAAKR
jgi:biopolymer transport protein ExbD